jgi:UDP-N-acetyl-2-amino-2-deoxyglucuronate dehydrogenase
MTNFAITGVAGYIAPRHLSAIHAVGGRLLAATDPHDAVGILDRYSYDVRFFPEVERFDRHLEKLRRGPAEGRLHYLSICSPNYLHDSHVRLALRVGADAICEKPLVINPWNLDPLEVLEQETGRRVYTVMQLRLHPVVVALKRKLRDEQSSRRRHQVSLTYITARGRWYEASWKASEERSGGVVTNIGVHLFDLLVWLFGSVEDCEVHSMGPASAAGTLELQRATTRWFLSTDQSDLPFRADPGRKTAYRQVVIDDEPYDFTEGTADLHSRVYEEILAGRGFGIADARPAIALTHRIRTTPVSHASHALRPLAFTV